MQKLLLLAVLTLVITGCASVMTAEQSAPELNKPSTEKLAIAVLDHRPYIVDGDKTSNFEGLSRTTLGIPFSRYTYNQKPMSVFLTNRLMAGFKRSGIQVSSVETTPATKIKDITETGSKTLVVVLKEWKYDYHAFSDNSWYDFDIIIKDINGKTLINKNFVGEQDVPSLTANDIQLLYKARFELALKDSEIKAIL
ncbi:hypothetical protein [Pseudoalteromonas denitrificans]|jgi:hypothetical protein|uniref:Lipoprotein n=1 Tax=Pseudoalteromonas denitrificans DSM 6059 TaxID=1123010 RepID=A0A1I1TPB2_9GAMM|nr:hypothetical protein [Pseudoalteromonas denitrificans]SFD60329.1 hypothetical protein SAMN02745724_04951 [Pseudoalteromonas denitrificans DSM 6059]